MQSSTIRVIDAETGGDLTILTNSRTHGNCQKPAWSPDGQSIAFHATVAGAVDIYTMNLVDGRGARMMAIYEKRS